MSLSRRDYDDIEEKAYSVLIDYQRYQFPIDVFQLCRDMNITLIKYSSLSNENQEICLNRSEKGFYSFTLDKPIIFYNDMIKSEANIRFIIAHEIKHYVCHDIEENDDVEILANHFAKTLLCPKALLISLKDLDIFDVINKFDVSQEVAIYALNGIKKRKRYYGDSIFAYEKAYLDYFLSKQ